MLVSPLSDPILRAAVRRGARPDEDVVLDLDAAVEALQRGWPRLVLLQAEDHEAAARLAHWAAGEVPFVRLDLRTREAWEQARRSEEIPPPRADWWGRRTRELVAASALRSTWADGALRDLSRAAGARLPHPFRGLARRVLEHPSRYHDLHELAELTGLSRGALKARFRRRDLPSPYTYVRWLRILAAAHVLSDASVTTLDASMRLGFTTNGNFCRTIRSTTGLTPTALRDRSGWYALVAAFAREHLAPAMLEGWSSLEDVFLRQVA